MQQAYGLEVATSLQDVCDRRHMALLVYDMQVGIAGRLPGAGPVIEACGLVLEAARSAGVRVFFCRHMTLPSEVAGAAQLRGSMALQRVTDPAQVTPNFLRESPGFPIIPELQPRPSEAVFDKLGMSAFAGSLLDYALRDAGLQAFAVVGAVLELGIDPTLRHGADLGYLPVLVEDACYSLSEQSKQASLAGLRMALRVDAAGLASALAERVTPARTGT